MSNAIHPIFFETVTYQKAGKVATLTLNRADCLNAFNRQLRLDLLGAIQTANQDTDVRIVVLTGAGKGFSSGADLKETLSDCQDIEAQLMDEYRPILNAISESDKTFIAAVQGVAAGIGGALALTCDLVVMAESAYLYQAFSAIGLVPDGGATWHLINSLGYKKTYALMVEAGKLSAHECEALGLINRVVPNDQVLSHSLLWAERLAEGAPLAQKYLKKLLQQAPRASLNEMIALEAQYQNQTFQSQDFSEGVEAFFAKRKPIFQGR